MRWDADSQEVQEMRTENEQLKVIVVELTLKNRALTPTLAGGVREKSLLGKGMTWDK